jgi:hypothetical protein
VLSVLVGVLAVAGATAHLRRISRGLEVSSAVERGVRRLGPNAREIGSGIPGLETEEEWIETVLTTTDPRMAIALLNERLGDVARETDVGSEIPRVSARVALTSGTALALGAVLQDFGARRQLMWGAATFLVALVAAFSALHVGRVARARSGRQIESWNAVVKALTRRLPGPVA